jgi:hypothetical protein
MNRNNQFGTERCLCKRSVLLAEVSAKGGSTVF